MTDRQQEMGYHEERAQDLPISIHEHMLGVDICIHPERMYREIHGLTNKGGLGPEPEIHSVGSSERDLRAGSRERTYIAHWARRNL